MRSGARAHCPPRQRLHGRIERPDRIARIELDLQPALPAIQIHAGLGQRRLVDRDRHALFLCERADTADMISGQPLGIGRPHHVRGLAGKRRREFLHADFAIRRHHDADRLAVDLRH